jgi:HSP20 family protein
MKSETGNKLVWILVVLLVAVTAMQGVIIAKLYRTPDKPEQAKSNSPIHMDLVPKSGTTPPAGNKPHNLPQPPIDPFDDFGFDADAWDPFQEFRTMRQQMDQLFNDSFGRFRMSPNFDSLWGASTFSPSMDVEEKNGNYIIRMDIPGADKSNISVSIEDREVTVSGTVDETVEEQGQNQLRKERRSGRFNRSFPLPGPVKADEMEAEYSNGVLVITVPKAEEKGTSRSVEVK